MVFLARKKWSAITVLIYWFKHINSQMAMMGMPAPPMIAMAPPVHMMAVAFPIEIRKKTSTTTTTTEKTLAFAVPVPMPMAFGLPMPPPPPFFPKPGQKVPMFPPPPPPPMAPMAMPAPPPVVVVPFPPFPPFRPFRPKHPRSSESSSSSCSSCSESSCSDTSCSSESSSDWSGLRKRKRKGKSIKRNRRIAKGKRRKGKRKGKKIGKRFLRRNFEDYSSDSGNEFVKPVLTFMSKNGKVKIKKQMTHDQAENLINDNAPQNKKIKKGERVHVTSRKNEDDPSRVLVISSGSDGESPPDMRRQLLLRNGASDHILGEGRKQLVFKPPDFKKIANLSVSFDVV